MSQKSCESCKSEAFNLIEAACRTIWVSTLKEIDAGNIPFDMSETFDWIRALLQKVVNWDCVDDKSREALTLVDLLV